ncbi:GIY-YIG nuclease family protein, partial [Vibrio lentus]
FMERLHSYTGHGGNNQLYTLLNEKGMTYADNFQYSILEIADTHKTKDEILARESYWKNVLASRQFGYNDN